jgi:4Fe-4S ferredoxin
VAELVSSALIIVVAVYTFLFLLYIKLRPFLAGARKPKMVIYEDLCNGCGNCVVVCPSNALKSSNVSGGKGPNNGEVVMDVRGGIPLEINIDACLRVSDPNGEPCKLCIDACPLDAIDFTY